MTDPMTWTRREAAIEEAAHAYAMWRYGYQFGVVSIRPSATLGGCVLPEWSAEDNHLWDLIDGHHALDGLDPVARRHGDRWIVVLLAGPDARDQSSGQAAAGKVIRAELPTPRDLSPERAEELARHLEKRHDLSDDDNALSLAIRLVGIEAAATYLGWHRIEARRMNRAGAAPISHLADDLRRVEVIDGADAVAIFEAHERKDP